jgi:aryl-alcohol dehydrogenase-like predicted oxidoreductase
VLRSSTTIVVLEESSCVTAPSAARPGSASPSSNFGTRWGSGATLDEARQVFDAFAEAGGTFIDTANGYQFGESEEQLGEFLAADRDHFTLATEFTGSAAAESRISTTGNSRKNMISSVEAALAVQFTGP